MSNQILKVLELVEDHLLVRTVGLDGFDQGRDHLLGRLCCDASFGQLLCELGCLVVACQACEAEVDCFDRLCHFVELFVRPFVPFCLQVFLQSN